MALRWLLHQKIIADLRIDQPLTTVFPALLRVENLKPPTATLEHLSGEPGRVGHVSVVEIPLKFPFGQASSIRLEWELTSQARNQSVDWIVRGKTFDRVLEEHRAYEIRRVDARATRVQLTSEVNWAPRSLLPPYLPFFLLTNLFSRPMGSRMNRRQLRYLAHALDPPTES